MFRMYASNSHSYTHLILALGIVREPTLWGFITSQYPGIHDIGLANVMLSVVNLRCGNFSVSTEFTYELCSQHISAKQIS